MGRLTDPLHVVSLHAAHYLGGLAPPLWGWGDPRRLVSCWVGRRGRRTRRGFEVPLACPQRPPGTHEVGYLESDLRCVRHRWTRGLPPSGQRPWTGPHRLAALGRR